MKPNEIYKVEYFMCLRMVLHKRTIKAFALNYLIRYLIINQCLL